MKLSIDLSPAQADRLIEEAKRVGLTAEQLAHAAVVDLLDQPESEFQAAVDLVLKKNEELYRRLG